MVRASSITNSNARWVFLAVLSGFLISVFMLNYWCDVSGLSTYAKIYDLANKQGAAQVVAWDRSFDQRAWVKSRLENGACPSQLVLGSSTVGKFAGPRLLNGWMSDIGFEDLEAITAILFRHQCYPSELILGVDHWLFNDRFANERWFSLFSDYLTFARRFGANPKAILWEAAREKSVSAWSRFKERLSYETTLATARAFWRQSRDGGAESQPVLLDEPVADWCLRHTGEHFLRAYGGNFISCPNYRQSSREIASIAEKYVVNNAHSVRDWSGASPARLKRLAYLLKIWNAKGVRVILVAMPFHPLAFSQMQANQSIHDHLAALDRELTQIAGAQGAKYFNFRDPQRSGCPAEAFLDGHHSDESCAAHLLSSLNR